MGKVRTKVIETVLEPEKLEKIKEVEEKPLEVVATTEEKFKAKEKKERPPKQRSRRYKQSLTLIDKSRLYPVEEAIELVKKTANAGFDPTVEAHVNLGLDPAKSEHQLRINITLPHLAPS